NKIDRPDERHEAVLNEIFDLFAALDATNEQLDFPVLYGSGRDGWMATDPAGPKKDLVPLFELVVRHVPPPTVEEGPFRLLATTLEADPYLGRILTGRISEDANNKDAYEVAGRGELQLGILIETMRREGFELTVSRPRVVMKFDAITRQKLEPIEEVIIDVDEAHSGIVVQKLSERRGDLQEMRPSGGGRQRLVFHVPTRGLIGYHGELLTDTRGTAVMNRLFHAYAPFKGEIAGRRTGVLISNGTGEATAYSLFYLQDRGAMLIDPQTRVYEGMIIGQHTRDND